jgi:GT2 family glycosyltransferase
LDSVLADAAAAGLDVELIVVDNASTDDTPDAVAAALPRARLMRLKKNLGVPGGRNFGAARSEGDILFFIDNDATLQAGALTAVVRAFEADPQLGIVAARVERAASGELDMGCWVFGRDPGLWGKRRFETYSFAGGACAIRRAAFETAGGFWPEFFFAREEEDLAIRIMDAGYRVVYQPDVVVLHSPSPSNRTSRARHLALSLGNSMLVYWRNQPVPLAAGLSLGKALLFTARCFEEKHPMAAPLGVLVALEKAPRAFRSRRCVSIETVRRYRALNPNAHVTLSAFRRRLTEVAIETGVRAPNQAWSAVQVRQQATDHIRESHAS